MIQAALKVMSIVEWSKLIKKRISASPYAEILYIETYPGPPDKFLLGERSTIREPYIALLNRARLKQATKSGRTSCQKTQSVGGGRKELTESPWNNYPTG